MGRWLSLALAWLLGVICQTSQASLAPERWAVGVLAAAGGLALMVMLIWQRLQRVHRGQRGHLLKGRGIGQRTVPAPARRATQAGAWLWCLACLACFGVAWSSTELRAAHRMAERLPSAWLGVVRPVVVAVQGLPQRQGAMVVFDARVQAWGDEGDSAVAASEQEVRQAPRLLSLRMSSGVGSLPRAGQRWRLSVRLHEPDGVSNPGGFDPTLGYFERGVRAVGVVPANAPAPVMLAAHPRWPWQGLIDRFRQDIRERLFVTVPDQRAAGVLAGLSVGDQSAIDHADWDVFRKAGLGHVIAISGTHIAMMGWLVAWAARRVWSRWHGGMHVWPASDVALWCGVAASALYALLAGWGVPAQRTVAMMWLVAVMRASGRRWPWPMVCLSAAVLLTVLDPWCIRQPGFWLSFVAVAVLMSAGLNAEGLAKPLAPAPNEERGRARAARWLASAARAAWQGAAEMTSAQWLVTWALLPLIIVCFGQVSVIGAGVNLVAIPLFTLAITPLALLGMVWTPCWSAGAWLLGLLMAVLQGVTAWPYATFELPDLPWWSALPAVLAGCALALPWRMRWRLALLPFALVLGHVPHGWRLLPDPSPGHFQILSVDIGQGTAVLVRTRHHRLLFDAGPKQGDSPGAGERILVPLFRAMGEQRLDALVISHEDNDHVGGAQAVMDQMQVARLMSSLPADHPLRMRGDRRGLIPPHEPCGEGLSWTWDGVRFRFLHPTADDLAARARRPKRIEPNAVSCVLRIEAGGHVGRGSGGAGAGSALLTGDIGREQERVIIDRAAGASGKAETLQADLLMAPHHGSATSSSSAFLKAVSPRQIVIQAGHRNRYGHPAAEVTARYDDMGLAWIATTSCGMHLWSSGSPEVAEVKKGTPLRLGQCWRDAHRHYWQGS
ncbi:MAG: DNA internalization-related competence protein ComEC/Rec2 [Aquabacterium sp.]